MFRKWSPVQMCSSVLPTCSSMWFSLVGFMLRSLIYLDLSFVHGNRYRSIFILLHVDIQLKLGNNLPQGPTIPLLFIYPKDAQSYHKYMCSRMLIATLLVIVRTWKQSNCPLNEEWIKMWYRYTMEYNISGKILTS